MFCGTRGGADLEDIKQKIINMKNYFEGYKVIIHFITEQELKEKHNQMPHGGSVICSGFTSTENRQIVEYSLKLILIQNLQPVF